MDAQKPKQNQPIGIALHAIFNFQILAFFTIAICGLPLPVLIFGGVWLFRAETIWQVLTGATIIIVSFGWIIVLIIGLVWPDCPDDCQILRGFYKTWVEFFQNPSGLSPEDKSDSGLTTRALFLIPFILFGLYLVLTLIFDLPLPECDEDYY